LGGNPKVAGQDPDFHRRDLWEAIARAVTQLPINQPKFPVNNFHQDGMMRFNNRPGRTNYDPNSSDKGLKPTGVPMSETS
jgi:catalase